jgi:arabinose-5-phosphate isomerase
MASGRSFSISLNPFQKVANNIDKVREILRIESAAIDCAADQLSSEAVDLAIEILMGCTGKVIVFGVGKSGVIGQKIAQTMTSTGTVALFVNPSDAMHGGLGVVSPNDVVISLSNSGETDELLAILPTLKQRGVKIIAIVGNGDSTLARGADAVLNASVDKEACPLNLAPTASTTVALAIGDALAMALMEAKGLTEDDFAVNHPAGRLGKRLTLRVRDLMHESANVEPEAGWLMVVKEISKASLGAVNVVDASRTLLGIITDGDLRRTIERTAPEQLASITARTMMTANPITASPQMLAFDALELMENRPSQISVLPVVEDDRSCVGLLRIHDIIKSGL